MGGSVFRIIIVFCFLIDALALIALVLMHSGKDAGLSGAFGVGSSSFGSTQVMERNLTRLTVVAGVLLFVLTIALGFVL
jgi:preprotein translocase subunit SecG